MQCIRNNTGLDMWVLTLSHVMLFVMLGQVDPLNFSEHQYPHPENEGDFRTCQIELSEGTDTVICVKP